MANLSSVSSEGVSQLELQIILCSQISDRMCAGRI